jgi:hypothetical protein
MGIVMTEPAKDEALERMNETLKRMHRTKKSPRGKPIDKKTRVAAKAHKRARA